MQLEEAKVLIALGKHINTDWNILKKYLNTSDEDCMFILVNIIY